MDERYELCGSEDRHRPTQKIFYGDEFFFHVCLKDASGMTMTLPEGTFVLRLITIGTGIYKVPRTDMIINDDGDLVVHVRNHGLLPGRLRVEFVGLIPSVEDPEHPRKVSAVTHSPIELTAKRSHRPSQVDIDLVLPAVKGDPGEPGPPGPPGPPGDGNIEYMTEEELQDIFRELNWD